MQQNRFDSMPLSNAEVSQLIEKNFAVSSHQDPLTAGYLSMNEQGNEYRKLTREYLFNFNEFQLPDQIQEIRR